MQVFFLQNTSKPSAAASAVSFFFVCKVRNLTNRYRSEYYRATRVVGEGLAADCVRKKMYFKLKYVEGAIPGGKRKAGAVTGGDKREKSRKYEREGRERVFLEKWKEGRPWLQFEDGAMTCKDCKLYYEKLNRPVQGHNSFIKGCTNLKISAISDHESSKNTQMCD